MIGPVSKWYSFRFVGNEVPFVPSMDVFLLLKPEDEVFGTKYLGRNGCLEEAAR